MIRRAAIAAAAVAIAVGMPSVARAEGALVVDCAGPTHRISPYIYGVGDSGRHPPGDALPWELGATAHRWGGNSTSRYNWEADAWNTGSDWFFHNVRFGDGPKKGWERFLDDDAAHGITSALTVPTIGWIAKDTTSASYPRTRFAEQHAFATEDANAGDGLSIEKKPLSADPNLTSIPAPPEKVAQWVRAIRERRSNGQGAPRLYFLDNEPTLWSETHRDLHPQPVTFDELLKRTLEYAKAVRKADPDAKIAGPSLWGWVALFDSGKDAQAGHWLHPDRLAHGNQPLLPWWLSKVRAEEKRIGVKLIDVVDVHFYPASEALQIGRAGATDDKTNALRLRATRGLWDPNYKDESWIADPIELLPRLRRWIDENAPGLGISIGEWNFGAENHVSGGLAVAEALGRFAQENVEWAFYWTAPPKDSPAAWAFRAYRNYDGKGSTFGDSWLASRAPDDVSLFASRDSKDGKLVLVVINRNPKQAKTVPLQLRSCPKMASPRLFVNADGKGFTPLPNASTAAVTLPPYSITVVELPPAR